MTCLGTEKQCILLAGYYIDTFSDMIETECIRQVQQDMGMSDRFPAPDEEQKKEGIEWTKLTLKEVQEEYQVFKTKDYDDMMDLLDNDPCNFTERFKEAVGED